MREIWWMAVLVSALAGCSGTGDDFDSASEDGSVEQVQSELMIGGGSLGLLPSECKSLGCRTERREACDSAWMCICGGGNMCIDEGKVGDSCTRLTTCCNGCCSSPVGPDGCQSQQAQPKKPTMSSPVLKLR